MKFIINKKSVSLTKEVTRTLAVVTSCCTNSVKFEKVTPKVPGYGCWPDVTLIASSCCSDGDVPTSGLGLSKDYYAFVLNLTSVQKFPQNSHRIHKNSAQFPYPSISIPYPYPSEFPYIYIPTAALTTGPAICSKATPGLYPVARKLLLISHPTAGKRLSWLEHIVG